MLQEKRIFTETPLNAPKCQKLLTKLLYLLLTQGDTFTRTEATDTFFALTRLFQSSDVSTLALQTTVDSLTPV